MGCGRVSKNVRPSISFSPNPLSPLLSSPSSSPHAQNPNARPLTRGTSLPPLLSPPADNFDDYWRVASKVTPATLTAPGSLPAAQSSMHTRPPSADPQGAPDRDGAYNVRSVPIRLYLPEGPVLQDLAPPVLEDGASSNFFR